MFPKEEIAIKPISPNLATPTQTKCNPFATRLQRGPSTGRELTFIFPNPLSFFHNQLSRYSVVDGCGSQQQKYVAVVEISVENQRCGNYVRKGQIASAQRRNRKKSENRQRKKHIQKYNRGKNHNPPDTAHT